MSETDNPRTGQKTLCGLCGQEAVLKNSHILPAFVFRWLKDTSLTGHMRTSENPRMRVQDGLKKPLLCGVCEGNLGRWESSFAKEVFYPYSADEKSSIRYGNWMLKFCTSVSWRVLKHAFEENGLKSWTDTERLEAGRALDRWRAVIMGKYDHPGPYEQHLLPLGPIAEKPSSNPAPNNINRYFMRGIELDIARGKGCSFTFAKMGRFALFGFLQPSRFRWSGSRVSVKTGEIKPRKFTLPVELRDYLYARAQKHADVLESVPDHQVGKIEEAALETARKGGGRDQLKAMSADAEMFGRDALLRK